MTNPLATGPAGAAVWEEQQLGAGVTSSDGDGRPLTLLTLPDAANATRIQAHLPPLYYYLPRTPMVARDAAGAPIFSLSLLLSRAPTPTDVTIADLITHGLLSFDVTVGLPEAQRAQLSADPGRQYQPLFARDARFSLMASATPSAQSGDVLVTATGIGANTRASLSLNLDQLGAQAVLNALQGGQSNLTLACEVTYRSAGADRQALIQVDWPVVYDALAAHFEPGDEVTQREVQILFIEMIQSGILPLQVLDGDGQPLSLANGDAPAVDPLLLFPPFMRLSAIILQRLTWDLAADDPANRYRLRQRPGAGYTVDIQQMLTGNALKHITLTAPLAAVLGGVLTGVTAEQSIHLISPTGAPLPGMNLWGPAPRRLFTTVPRQSRAAGSTVHQLAAFNGAIKSPALALRPDSLAKPTLTAVLASDAVQLHPADQSGRLHWAVDDMVLARPNWWDELTAPTVQALPVIDDPAAPLWHDRLHPDSYWYAPIFEVVQPAPTASTATSPFLFTYLEQGHDHTGRAGLSGTIRLTLHQRLSDQSQAALQALGNPAAHPVALLDLAVWLDLPFRDESGATRRQRFPATVTQTGDHVTATISLLDDWVRLAYGALATPNFQSQPARVKVAYSYTGYVLIPEQSADQWELLGGRKIMRLPVVHSAEQLEEVGNHPYLDAGQLAIQTRAGAFHFSRERATTTTTMTAEDERAVGNLAQAVQPGVVAGAMTAAHTNPGVAGAATMAATQLTTTLPVNVAITHPLPVVVHPELEASLVLQNVLRQNRYATQTLGSEATSDLLFPCNTLGAFYLHTNGAQRAIGCQDAFQLGQTTYHQYEQITDADVQSPFYQLYRSLQQPGRFLVVPTAYRITRYATTEGDKAYRPVIYLYSTLDPTDAANNRAVVMATLQPDLPPYVRRNLTAALMNWAARPVIDYVTAVESQLAYSWSIGADPSLHLQPQAAKLWDGFQVSLSTDVDGAPQLQAMLQRSAVAANVTFTLPDGVQLQTALRLDLGDIVGPWSSGPIAVTLQGGAATLTNKIEHTLNLTDLAFYNTDGERHLATVDRTLASQESCVITLPGEATEAYPAYTMAPGDPATLTEVRSFVEDIHTNVVFLNLINYANHGLKQLAIVAQIEGVAGSYPAPISEAQPIAAIDITLPLTSYLTNRTLQFQVTKTDNRDQISVTPWLEWPLDSRGNVVSLTWEMIG
ncbi:MAG: hypothetical protein R3C14_02950 [Caldilineaceae bacterium]